MIAKSKRCEMHQETRRVLARMEKSSRDYRRGRINASKFNALLGQLPTSDACATARSMIIGYVMSDVPVKIFDEAIERAKRALLPAP